MWTRKPYLAILFLLLFLGVTLWAVTQVAKGKSPAAPPTANPAAVVGDEEVALNEDPWEELQQIVSAYSHPTGVRYQGQVQVIDGNAEQDKVLEETPFEYTLYREDFHYRLGEVEMVGKPDFLLQVDHLAKTIAYAPNALPAKGRSPFKIQEFRQLLEAGNASLKVSRLNDTRILTVEGIVDPTIQGYRIYYAPDTYRISKIEMGMQRLTPLESEGEEDSAEGPGSTGDPLSGEITVYTYYVVVQFSKVQELNFREGDFHPEARFVVQRGDSIQLMPAFNSFTLMDATE